MSPRRRLLRRVGRVRRRAALIGLGRVLLVGAAGSSLGPLLSAAALPWLGGAARPWAVGAFAALGLAAGGALARWESRRARPLLSAAEAAGLLAGQAPEWRELVVTGADLAAWGEGGADARGASAELAGAQVERAAEAAARLSPRRAAPLRAAAPALGAALLAALLLTGWARWNPGGSFAAWAALLTPRPPAPVAVGNLKLTLQPPAYTGLPASALEGVSGAVEGLRGTRVTLEGQLSDPVAGGRWEGSDGRSVPLEVSGRGFRVTWVLDRAGTYDLRFERGGRRVPSDFRPQALALRPDERPRAELRLPESDLEVASNAEVEVRFAASDDFRIDRVELVLQGDVEVRVPARLTPGRAVEGTARFLPLAFPKLGAGASLRVEAWDSDTVSGPKAGASRSVYLTFLDRKRLLGDIEALAERLFEALVVHLADHLEAPAAGAERERLRPRAADLLKLLDALAARVRQGAQEGSVAAAAVVKIEESLHAALDPFVAGAGEPEGIVAELERDVLFLDRLLRNLQMEDALSLGDELQALQRSLFDDLQAGASPRDLVKRVQQIQDLLRRVAQKLRRDAGEMPDAFANADAVKDMPESELDQQLKELRKALEKGDRKEAQRAAEKLLETLSRWMKALEDAAEGAAGRESSPLQKEMARLESEVQELLGDQERVLQDTRALADEASRRASSGMKEALQALLERLEQRLSVVGDLARRTEALTPRGGFHAGAPVPPPSAEGEPRRPGPLDLFEASSRVSSAMSELRRAVRSDLGAARSGAEQLDESFQGLRDEVAKRLEEGDPRRAQADGYRRAARREVDAILSDLEALERRRRDALGPKEGAELRGLEAEEGRLGDRTGALAQELEDLARRTPFAGGGLPDKARGAGRAMGQAGERLGQGNPFGAVEPETRALEGLSELARDLSEARRQMRQGQGGGQGQGFRMMPKPGQQGGEGREVDRSRVEIPKEAEARELKAFREEVLRAMRRREYPKHYEDEVERYYERLIR